MKIVCRNATLQHIIALIISTVAAVHICSIYSYYIMYNAHVPFSIPYVLCIYCIIYQVLNAFGPFGRSDFDLGADIGCDVFMFMIINSRTKFGVHYSCNDIRFRIHGSVHFMSNNLRLDMQFNAFKLLDHFLKG